MTLGILLYAMVWGSFPFYTEDEICCDEVNLDFDITPECKDIIRKCLKKCPKERPSLLELFDTPFIKQTKINEGNEDLTNFPVPGTSASSNSFTASNITNSGDLNNASPNSNLSSEDLTNAPNSGTFATFNSFTGSNLSSENLTNASNLGTSSKDNSFSDSDFTRSEDLNNAATPNSFNDSDLTNAAKTGTSATPNSLGDSELTNPSDPGTSATLNSLSDSDLTVSTTHQNSNEKSVEDKLIETKITLGEKRKCETTQIQTDFELNANNDTTIKRKKQGFHQSFEHQTDAVEAAFMFHEKESRKGQKNTKKEKKRSRSR